MRIEVIKLVDEVLNALGTASNDRELSTVITLRERIGAAGPLIERDPPYRKLVTLIRELRDALANLVRAKAPANTKTVEDALETGEFLVAAKAAKASQPVKPKVETYGPAPATGRGEGPTKFVSGNVALPADRLPPVPTLRIIAPADVRVGQAVDVRTLIEPPLENSTVSWTVIAGIVGQEQRKGMRFIFVPHASGTVIIGCEVSHPQLREPLIAQTSVRVAPSAAELAVVATRERMSRREWVMSAITGVFIAGSGTMIFSDTFVGSWRDFLFAALWGFTADVGMGRLRTLAEPLMARQIPSLPDQPGVAPTRPGAGG